MPPKKNPSERNLPPPPLLQDFNPNRIAATDFQKFLHNFSSSFLVFDTTLSTITPGNGNGHKKPPRSIFVSLTLSLNPLSLTDLSP